MKLSAKKDLSYPLFVTVVSSFLLVFSEWLFLITKPSMFSRFDFLDNVSILLSAFGLLAIFMLLLIAPLICIAVLANNGHVNSILNKLTLLVPAFCLTAMAILLVDNFTYTVFGFNTGAFTNWIKNIYGLMFVVGFIWLFLTVLEWKALPFWQKHAQFISGSLITLLFISFIILLLKTDLKTEQSELSVTADNDSPNILVLSTDGLVASHMSAYGYSRETTPFLRKLTEDSLLAENSYTNSGESGGSIASLLTGKLPTKTKVIYPPDILSGIDVYQHLPGILRNLGYRNADFSIRHYADPYDLNMRDAFDLANARAIERDNASSLVPDTIKSQYVTEIYFLEQIIERISNRMKHAFSIKDMVDVYSVVKGVEKQHMRNSNDLTKTKALLDFIGETSKPFFAHVYYLGSHGETYRPRNRTFSRGKEQYRYWMTDFYDDAVLDFDNVVEGIIKQLKSTGLYDNTIIIISSDHTQKWDVNEKIPLIIKFPRNDHSGRIKENTQRLDLAPTLLDYLNISIPKWMTGKSLISGKLDSHRPIISVVRTKNLQEKNGWYSSTNGPPFYTLGTLSVTYCQRRYLIDLSTGAFSTHDIESHTAPCRGKELPSNDQAIDFLLAHLTENDYDISSLKIQRTGYTAD